LIDTNVAVSFFLMRKITTLSLSITYLLLLTTVYSYSAGVYDQSNIKLIPGSNTPVVKDCLGLNYVYIYDDYVIYTQKSGDFEGSNIYIPKLRTTTLAQLVIQMPSTLSTQGNSGGQIHFPEYTGTCSLWISGPGAISKDSWQSIWTAKAWSFSTPIRNLQ